MTPKKWAMALLALLPLGAGAAMPTQLAGVLQRRLQGDRSGACIAAAVIDGGVTQAYVCAGGGRPRIHARSAFEIGSISKTMNAFLLAQFIGEGRVTLDTPLAQLLPPGAQVPQFQGQPILLRHVVTHRSGLPALPPGFAPPDMDDPYAYLDENLLLAALAQTTLTQAPGKHFEYSNFASMLLSAGLARLGGEDYETLLRERLFLPLGMRSSFISAPAAGLAPVPGHMSNGRVTPPWTFGPNLAGVGGVRATLGDMVAYVQAQLGLRNSSAAEAIALTQQDVPTDGEPAMGMNWIKLPLGSGTVLLHDGGTGGFAAFAGFDRARGRGVVLLSDTAIPDIVEIGAHLFDPTLPLPPPRRLARPPAVLVDALVGDYRIDDGQRLRLLRRGSALAAQVDGQPRLALGYDSGGDFFAATVDVLLRPQREADGSYSLQLHQLGGVRIARRVGAVAAPAPLQLEPQALAGYAGDYALLPEFTLRVYAEGATLYVQGSGQPALAVTAVEADVFVAAEAAAQLRFERRDGRVVALVLKQNGQELRGERR
ncbi:serine hydrolase domain-containing protein [Tahibacter harae]|uniref:Beta-lactamase n=1 Tax=Tahibacter harae TaxID=2963937 RepID=A0ABT1QWJ0_9GAMM|nr:serine hydrolase domain-containing protein [Tahibacter harae]MCQ4166657.1 beta-lactamase family protein [Tahibacter harae]